MLGVFRDQIFKFKLYDPFIVLFDMMYMYVFVKDKIRNKLHMFSEHRIEYASKFKLSVDFYY